MEIYQAILLGIIQGATEFFPVSSSGHLTLFSHYLGVTSNLFFDVLLHFGTLIPLVVVFRKEILALFRSPKKVFYLVVATIPAGIVGLLFNDTVELFFQNVKLLPVTFLFTAIVIFVTQRFCKKVRGEVNFTSACVYGVFQAVALLPGVSRSGMCLSAGRLTGVENNENSSFAFLMSLPVILGSILLESVKAVPTASFSVYIIFGVLASTVSGFIALYVMKRLAQKNNYLFFSLYLVLLSAVTLLTV